MTSDKEYMLAALKLANEAYKVEEVPIGAVVVKDGKIIGTGHNKVEAEQTVSAHAEIIAIDTAAKHSNNWRLNDCSIYVTIEPCAMCLTAIGLARISKVVFGAFEPRFGATGKMDDLLSFCKHPEIISGVYEKECLSLVQQFFREKRKKD